MKKNNIIPYFIIAAVLLIFSFSMAGCTGKTVSTTTAETTATNAAGSAGAANEITIENNTFKPDSLTIKVGDTVTWINKDSYDHTATSKTGEFDSGNLANGAKFSFTFEKEGTYDYICTLHTFMTGKIIVTK
ncbi:MAG: cupredoxin family copper-binding protein [Actinobacteria bacterium]|nr:cupredoxin family copper-binding protein [Actinomycetota bacterium]